jgi:hypothetical protein
MDAIYVIICLFGLAALAGMYLLALVLQKKETPKFVAFAHGLFAAIAIITLKVYASNAPKDFTACLVIFVLAALGGLVLIYRDLTARPIPRWLAVTHGLMAVAGFVLLLVRAFSD